LSPPAVVVSVMNKPAVNEASIGSAFAARSLCSYTNDVARGLERCQAGLKAKSLACRIIAHLPRLPVH
jgi:hypothetical protein